MEEVRTKATFIPGEGTLVTITGPEGGLSVVIQDTMTIAAVQNHIQELIDWLS